MINTVTLDDTETWLARTNNADFQTKITWKEWKCLLSGATPTQPGSCVAMRGC